MSKPNVRKPIGSIIWPCDARECMHLLRSYMFSAVEGFGIVFGPPAPDPMAIVRGLLAGTVDDKERESALDAWWAVTDRLGIRDFQSKDALTARLAISLLSTNEQDVSNLGEHLSWFGEVLSMLGANSGRASEMMHAHFDFR